ncbi:class I SAM-dependent methyltransferase [Cylindrospermopsis curvispora GIHE-G1]|uniref:Class I SAM-dependent methyltransferase n=1 Tax=Cylindrospermopsis curvispora GIHE-G1 TaxID=2666332 RepID=A0A7H0F1R4_9CYAN|nr:class I SAM-dependent methyltransferase [Cylindrospermopsis curvispora GIHE-G1]
MNFESIIKEVGRYYTEKFISYGPSPQGADWNSIDSQLLRFKQLLKVCNSQDHFSINDYGCGYGALVNYMNSEKYDFSYFGYDISPEMLEYAKQLYDNYPNVLFSGTRSDLPISDYTVASGIFNVKNSTTDKEWQDYILSTLEDLFTLSQYGFAFNILTRYSDADKMRPNLYYEDPCFLFDYCKTNFSKNVAILHDYNLYEFTVIVRKQ